MCKLHSTINIQRISLIGIYSAFVSLINEFYSLHLLALESYFLVTRPCDPSMATQRWLFTSTWIHSVAHPDLVIQPQGMSIVDGNILQLASCTDQMYFEVMITPWTAYPLWKKECCVCVGILIIGPLLATGEEYFVGGGYELAVWLA